MSSDTDNIYSVNWKNHMSYVRKAFEHLLNTNELTDVTLYCEGKKIAAHKMLLSACSAYFRETFKDVPCPHPVVILFGIEFTVLSDILHFIYNGEVSVDTSKLDSFLKTAKLLQISGLTDSSDSMSIPEEPVNHVEETSYMQPTASTSSSPEKRGSKRPRSAESNSIQSHDKAVKQEGDSMFISDVKCEPIELVSFGDPLEDPLSQEEQGESQNTGEEEFKICRAELAGLISDISSDSDDTSLGLEKPALAMCTPVLPEKSKKRYELTYNLFKEWCKGKQIESDITEKTLLAYFLERAQILQSPSSLWSEYSMLKATMYLNENLDISKYEKLRAFLKRKNVGYRPKKVPVFSKENVIKFLTEAPDIVYLLKKVVAIIAIAGACRISELCKLTVDDIQDKGNLILVNIVDSKNGLPRSFIITNNEKENFLCLDIFRKYFDLRPKDIPTNRFFLKYQNGKCHQQVVGKNSLAKTPTEIAKFLNLDNFKNYTGHSFRRTSTTLMAHSGIQPHCFQIQESTSSF